MTLLIVLWNIFQRLKCWMFSVVTEEEIKSAVKMAGDVAGSRYTHITSVV